MEILTPADPEYSKAIDLLQSDLPPMLPDISQLEKSGGIAGATAALGAEWALRATQNWQVNTQFTLGELVVDIGVPTFQMFESIAGVLGEDLRALAQEAILHTGESIQDAVSSIGDDTIAGKDLVQTEIIDGVGQGVQAASIVPIIGWAVKLLWGVGMGIRRLVSIAGTEPLGPVFEKTSFAPLVDQLFLKMFVDDVKTARDFTDIFRPPGQGWPFQSMLIENPDPYGAEGVRVIAAKQEGTWLGCVPGTGFVHKSLEFIDRPTEAGRYLPSLQGQAPWLWKHIMQSGTPAMFAVDASNPSEALGWTWYIYGLHSYLYQENPLNNEANLRATMKFYNKVEGDGRLFGWGTSPAPKEKEQDTYGPVLELHKLRKRQEKFLDTILVAYLDENYAALKNDTGLRDKWKTRRDQLLHHPARCDVNLNAVPDPLYRQALLDAGVGKPWCRAFGDKFAQAPKGVKPFVVFPKVPDGQPGMPMPGEKGKKRTKTKPPSWLLPVVLAGGGYAAYKAGLFKRLKR